MADRTVHDTSSTAGNAPPPVRKTVLSPSMTRTASVSAEVADT
jgi:hypothetical protein